MEVTTHQGERESRSQGEGAQVLTIDNDGEVREMRNAITVLAIIHYEHWRAGCPEIGHVRFGGGPSEKDQHYWHLVDGLPYHTPGSEGGPGKRTGGNTGTAPGAYLTNAEHAIAQHYFSIAVKLAAEADDPPMAGHVLRAMAHQAVDLGHYRQGLDLAAASMDGKRYLLASPRERALLGVVYARALGAAGQNSAAAQALITAEDDLASATTGDDEPSRVFFFGEASLAHQTACTLRDTGDLSGALKEFHRSVRTRKATVFTRTHAVTLGYLGAVQARRGEIDQACFTWSNALDAMDGIRSGRTRQAVVDMRAALSAFRRRGIPATVELDARACAYLNSAP